MFCLTIYRFKWQSRVNQSRINSPEKLLDLLGLEGLEDVLRLGFIADAGDLDRIHVDSSEAIILLPGHFLALVDSTIDLADDSTSHVESLSKGFGWVICLIIIYFL